MTDVVCLETTAELRIHPGDLTPHEVTRRLQITPSRTALGGVAWTASVGQERLSPSNGWFLSTEGRVASLDLRKHLDWLIAQIAPRKKELAALQKLPGMRMSVCCTWHGRAGHGGPTLGPAQMAALAELGLDCSVDVYLQASTR